MGRLSDETKRWAKNHLTNERPIFLGLVRYPPPHLVWWWSSPHFHIEAPSTGVAECRAGLVRWAPHMGNGRFPLWGEGGNIPFFSEPPEGGLDLVTNRQGAI